MNLLSRIRKPRFVCLIAALLLPITVFGQSSNGAISGLVSDDSGAALPGVTVTATNSATGVSRTTQGWCPGKVLQDRQWRFELTVSEIGS